MTFGTGLFLVLSTLHLAAQTDPQPTLNRYCVTCHSSALLTGDLNLENFKASNAKIKQSVIEQITLGEMPPKDMPQPTVAERAQLLALIRENLRLAARANAGDPGPVVLRRLNNAEYTHTIRDLTGVASLDPAREFPADSSAGEGFTNTGNALVMSPALITKYLDAAKGIASHAVLLPDGLRFSPSTSRSDWTNESLVEIRAFYARFTESGGAETVTQQGIALDKNRGGTLPLNKYLAATLEMRKGKSIAVAARSHGVSSKYLRTLFQILNSTSPSPLLDNLRKRWRTATPATIPPLIQEITPWQDSLWKFSSVGHIGKEDGPKAWMEPVTPLAASQQFQLKLNPAGDAATIYLATTDAGDGAAGDMVVWQDPRLTIPGRPSIRLRDVRSFVGALTRQRQLITSNTAASLSNEGADPIAQRAWHQYLGITGGTPLNLNHLEKKITKSATFEFVQGWGGSGQPAILANASDRHVRIPGNMKQHAVAMLPTATHAAAIGWRSPVTSPIHIEGTVTPAHAECGNGVAWALQLRRGGTRQNLAEGNTRGAKRIAIGPLHNIAIQTGDLLSILIGAREGNASCDLTDVELQLKSGSQSWSLGGDVSGNILAANPLGAWHFYSEPVTGAGSGTVIPANSLLARWQATEDPAQKRTLATALQALLTNAAPDAKTPDGALYRQLTSLAGPLFSTAGIDSNATSEWGLDPKQFDGDNLKTQAPSVIEIRLPADLVADSEFTVTGRLDASAHSEGSVQLQVLATPPTQLQGLQPSGTAVRTADGTWTSNNQRIDYAMPVIANENSAAQRRITEDFEQFRQTFPASLCYSKIVPVDEVVTLTLFHREDSHLSRLLLDDADKAKLDRMWEELTFISRFPITQVDVFEQLWQYATQDADPSKFEPLRQPILDRAAAFKAKLVAAEASHLDAAIRFADRAYRRPITPSEKDELRTLYAKLRQQDQPHEEALRLTLARILVSPAFLYRTEKAAPNAVPAPVTPVELSNRLSYFLWSSQPDERLRKAASTGLLPGSLIAETRRMRKDARVRRLATEFGASWLHIYGFDSLDEKSERHFPSFRGLRGDMYEESIRFLTDFFENNRSVLSLLSADHTFLNEALARHYNIPNITGQEWRRVDKLRAFGRGGILAHSTTLAKQSGASRTSPILRGNWVAEVLMGDKLPRPPKDVPQLPEDEATLTLTMRELTEKHTSDPRCYTCHKRIDPYGYALENYDAIGRFRDKDLGDRVIHTKTKVLDGTEIEGLDGLRQYLLGKGRHAFVRQFCRKLLGYALGRAVQLSDEPLLDSIEARLATTNYTVGTAIEMIVTSRQFREIRGRDAAQEDTQE
jgi:hypothetical protein